MSTGISSQSLRYTLLSKNVLSLDEQELYELSQLAGVIVDPSVFKIIMDLLKMNVAPQAILQVLKFISGQQPKKAASPESSLNQADLESRRSKSSSRGKVSSSRKSESRR